MSRGRVLVTGATGFIGRSVLAPLVDRGYEVCAVARAPQGDVPGVRWVTADLLRDPAGAVAEVRPELLLHLAWYAEHGRFWTSLENLRWTAATLELARAFAAAGGRRMVAAGTCAEYDWEAPAPAAEDATPLRPGTLYGAAKHGTRLVLEAAAAELGIEVAWGRVFFLYGPGEAPGRLVAAVARGLLAGERVPTGDGTAIRDFLHVDDVAAGFAALLDSGVTGAVNVASGEGRPLRDVIEAIAAAAGRPELLDIGVLPARPGDPAALVADVARLRDEVGFVPRIGLQEGIGRTVDAWARAAA